MPTARPARGAPGQGHLGDRDRWAQTRGAPGGPPKNGPQAHLVVLVVDAEAFAQVSEHLRTVLLELEVAGKVLPEFGGGFVSFGVSPAEERSPRPSPVALTC